MNLRDLAYLVAVAQQQHFGKAAVQCGVSQPALSMQLQKLEQTLGVALIERNSKNVRMTAAGQHIAQRAQSILSEVNDIKQYAKAQQNPLAGDFYLGAFPTLAPYYLPHIVPLIHAQLPQLNLMLVEEKTDVLLQQLQAGTLDAALIALPIDDAQLNSVHLFDDAFVLAVPPQHPLAVHSSISAQQLQNHTLLLLDEGHCLRAQALNICARMGAHEQQKFRATSLETLRHMVMAGSGITLMPQMAAQPNRHIVYIALQESEYKRQIGLVWRKKSNRAQCMQQLCAVLLGR